MNDKTVVRVASGAVIFHDDCATSKIMLVTSTKDSSRWVLPKGGVEENLTPLENADKEVKEEAGIACQFFEEIGRFECEGKCGWQEEIYYRGVFVSLIPWEEYAIRKREWVDIRTAIGRLSSEQGDIVLKAYGLHARAATIA